MTGTGLADLDLKQIQRHIPEIKQLGATLLAISPQSPDDALTMKQKNQPGFEVLSDIDQKVNKAYNLQFDPGQDYHDRRDLTLLNDDGSKTLPVPATLIINSNRKIAATHVEANYTLRMSAEEIIAILQGM